MVPLTDPEPESEKLVAFYRRQEDHDVSASISLDDSQYVRLQPPSAWQEVPNEACPGADNTSLSPSDTIHLANQTGASAVFSFIGVRLVLNGVKTTNGGQLIITVDSNHTFSQNLTSSDGSTQCATLFDQTFVNDAHSVLLTLHSQSVNATPQLYLFNPIYYFLSSPPTEQGSHKASTSGAVIVQVAIPTVVLGLFLIATLLWAYHRVKNAFFRLKYPSW